LKEPKLIKFENKIDPRGNLTFTEGIKGVPFDIKRVYWLDTVPDEQARGGHAHKSSKQVIVCIKGQIEVQLKSQSGEQLEFTLSEPNIGLYIPPLWWGTMQFNDQAMMIGLASDQFSEEDYIRNKTDF